MITNQGYWLLMVKVELSDRLELIKHQMKILQAKCDALIPGCLVDHPSTYGISVSHIMRHVHE